MRNINNQAQRTNFILGSTMLPDTLIQVQTVSIPGITTAPPTTGARWSVRGHLAPDTQEYPDITLSCVIDENMCLFRELLKLMQRQVDPERGTFSNEEFTAWLAVNDNKGKQLFRVDFHNTRLVSIGDIGLDVMDTTTTNTVDVTLAYDYYVVS